MTHHPPRLLRLAKSPFVIISSNIVPALARQQHVRALPRPCLPGAGRNRLPVEHKNQRVSLIASSILLVVLVALAFWQTSLDFGEFRPSGRGETIVLSAISTIVVLGAFTLGFIVFRSVLKLYVERRQNRLGSKIKTKLVLGALALSIVPVVCLVLFSFTVLNRTLNKWFEQPTVQIQKNSEELVERLNEIMKQKIETDAGWIASMPEVASSLAGDGADSLSSAELRELGTSVNAHYVALLRAGETKPLLEFRSGDLIPGQVEWRLPRTVGQGSQPSGVISRIAPDHIFAGAPVRQEGLQLGRVVVEWRIPQDLLDRRADMAKQVRHYASLQQDHREYRYLYSGILALISVFVLFVATWLALFLSKQIIVPIEALVEATDELSSGHLDFRVRTPAIDELAALVQSFNQMTQQLETHRHRLEKSNKDLAAANTELDARRRFIDAILGSITPGVISVSAAGDIQKVNSGLSLIFAEPEIRAAGHLRDLFSREDYEEIIYMMHRARRTGLASREFVIKREERICHLSVTISALEGQAVKESNDLPGFVIVLEDTSELLRAQKSAAWNEVARRVAHEIKNPLTPIALSAERMSRLLDRFGAATDPGERRQIEERFEKCTETIVREVQTLGTLVDEFAQFARFPAANPQAADLNDVVEAALDVFQGRLAGIRIEKDLEAHLPRVFVDPDKFKRVVVNLIDNAAEAIEGSHVREIFIGTAPGAVPDAVELTVADSGPGISAEDKEKLFLPYFSTKKRGTGLGLAIVNRILTEHQATIRVEDRRPMGSRFIIEVPTAASRAPIASGVGV